MLGMLIYLCWVLFLSLMFLDRRSQILFYPDYPLQIVRGLGQYFYDEHGQKYLDTTNNVACGKFSGRLATS